MEDFCGMLAAKDMEYLPELTEEELEHVLKCRASAATFLPTP